MTLTQWLKQKRVRRYIFARRIGVSPQMITAYCNGESWPSRDTWKKIVAETQGDVTPNDALAEHAS